MADRKMKSLTPSGIFLSIFLMSLDRPVVIWSYRAA